MDNIAGVQKIINPDIQSELKSNTFLKEITINKWSFTSFHVVIIPSGSNPNSCFPLPGFLSNVGKRRLWCPDGQNKGFHLEWWGEPGACRTFLEPEEKRILSKWAAEMATHTHVHFPTAATAKSQCLARRLRRNPLS